MKELKLLPCKIHKVLPKFRERKEPIEPFVNRGLYPRDEYTIREYYCAECESDKDTNAKNQVIAEWNRKQESK